MRVFVMFFDVVNNACTFMCTTAQLQKAIL